MAQAMSHTHTFEGLLDLLLALGGAGAAIGQRQFDVFINCKVANQVKRLEDEANFTIADTRALTDGELRHRLAIQPVISIRGRIEQAQNRKKRGLAAAR